MPPSVRAVLISGLLLVAAGRVCAAPPAATQVIDLLTGWNQISIQVGGAIPAEDFRSSLADQGSLLEVWGYQPGVAGNPGSWDFAKVPPLPGLTNDLETLEPGRAYWVRVSRFTQATLTGAAWDGNLSLVAGWNHIGFPGAVLQGDEVQELASVFGAQFSRIQQVWAFDSASQSYQGYDLTAVPQLKSLESVESGRGYWVYALEPFTLTAEPFLALESDADASPLQPEVAFNAGDPRWLGTDSAPYEGELVRFRGSEDASLDLNGNGILDTAFTQDTLRFEPGVTQKVISVGNHGASLVNWALVESVPWLEADVTSGVVSSEVDHIVLTVNRAGLSPGTITSEHLTVFIGGEERRVDLILDVSTAAGDWKGVASAERVNGKDIPLGAVDLALNLFMETELPSERRFRAVLNSDQALLFPRDVFMNGIFFAGNDFSLTTNFQMPAGDRNAPPYDVFEDSPDARGDKDADGDQVLDNENPFPFPVTREMTLLGQRIDSNRIEGSYVEALGGMLPNNQVIFIEGSFYLERSSLEPTRRSIFNEQLRQVTQIGGSTGPNFREQVIHVGNPVNIQGVVFTYDITFPAPTVLTINLTGPNGEVVTIHRNGATLPTGEIRLDDFNGTLGEGDWTLRVEWTAGSGERGYLNSWGLNIEGVATYSVTGRVVEMIETSPGNFEPDANAPISGARISLSGSNIIEQTASGADGSFSFGSLTENKYSLAITRQGFLSTSEPFLLSDANRDLGALGLKPLTISEPELAASPAVGFGPLFVELDLLVPDADYNALGANVTAIWDFGDGSPAVGDSDLPDDAVGLLAASHTFINPGHFVATVNLTGDGGSFAKSIDIHVHRSAADPAAGAFQLVDVRFAGSLAAPLSEAGPAIQVADSQIVASYDITNDDQPPLANVAAATVWQESKPDSAAFDMDREPKLPGTSFHPSEEDTDFFTQVGTPFHALAPEPADSTYTEYEQPQVNGNEIPDRFRLVVATGGFVFGNAPSRVGAFKILPGRAIRPLSTEN